MKTHVRYSFLLLLAVLFGFTSATKMMASPVEGTANAQSATLLATPADDGMGEKWQEQLFKQGNAVSTPLNLQTNGVGLTSIATTFLGSSLDVVYDMYEEGELDWLRGTKLVFQAKDNITGIIIEGESKERASADKGSYTNGMWTGTLAAGETLTLTSNDGILVHSIVVLYNGDAQNDEEGAEEEVTIELNLTKTTWNRIGNMNGEIIGTVSSNAKVFDYYMFTITCDDDPSQFISFNDLLSLQGNIICTSPTSAGYDLNKGLNYTFTAYCFDTPQYGAKPVATATYKFVGTGVAATVYNKDIYVVGTNLKENGQGLGYNQAGTEFDVTFSAPVAKVRAYYAMGMDGSMNFTATKKSQDGRVWTITMPESVLNEEGAVNVNIVATDAEGHQLLTASDIHPYAFNMVISPEDEDIEVPEKSYLLNDGTEFVNTAASVIDKFVYTRNFPNSNWQALYLPVMVPVSVLQEQGLQAAYINAFHQYDEDGDSKPDRIKMEVFNINEGRLYANTPYLVKALEPGQKEIVVESCWLEPADAVMMECSSMLYNFSVTGTYSKVSTQELVEMNSYCMSGGVLRHVPADSDAGLMPERWYLNITPRRTMYESSLPAEIKVEVIGEDEETSIESLQSNAVGTTVYDLSGRRVSGMQKGLYISNGKKYLVR